MHETPNEKEKWPRRGKGPTKMNRFKPNDGHKMSDFEHFHNQMAIKRIVSGIFKIEWG